MSLAPQLQSFVQGPAELTLAKALTYDRPAGLALVAALTADKLRSHLEALGEVASDKEVKKAARAAAYKLKSAGVAGGVQREAAVDLTIRIETENIAAATAPGFDGRLWIVLPTLPGAGGGEIDLRDQGRGQRIEPVAELSIGRIRKFQSEAIADRPMQPPLLVGLDLAARLVGLADEALTLSGKPVAPTIDHFKAWLRRAVVLGADPERASARAALGKPGALTEDGIERLAMHPLLGFIAAPPAAFDSIDKEFRDLLHGHEAIEKADFTTRGAALVETATRAWAAAPNGKRLAAMWLEATADMLLAVGDAEAAGIALAAADEVAALSEDSAPSHPLVVRAFKGAVDLESAWTHREAHVNGTARHE